MSKRVLLIEDDKIVRENTKEILELANYMVDTAKNGKEGVELAKNIIPDIIICDILMPELDGYGVLQIVSKLPELEHIPFIFLTAKTDHDNVRMGMEMGADDYISKPFEESELLRAIESRLRRMEVFEHKIPMADRDQLLSSRSSIFSIRNIEHFLSQKEVFRYRKGSTIYCTGNQSSHIFLIKKGLVKTYMTNDQGKELITAYYTDNQMFGYSSFARHIPHSENSKAVKATELYKINKDEIRAIINNNHHIIYDFIDLLAGHIGDIKKQLLLTSYGSVRMKTARTLVKLVKLLPSTSKNEIVITRINLASTIGIAKETLIRTLHDFKEENLIELNEKSIRIVDLNRLMRVQ